jgi:hypothetical protein
LLALNERSPRAPRCCRKIVGVEITQNYLSELETGKRKGPLELHQKIARFLGVPLDLLAPVAVSGKEADPIRFAKRKRVVVEAKRQRGQR